MKTLKELLDQLEASGALTADTVTGEASALRKRYIQPNETMTNEELKIVRNAYLAMRGPWLHFDIPNFEDVLFCGPDANSAAEDFQSRVKGKHGLSGLGTAIAAQFGVMDKYDVLVLIAGDGLLRKTELL